MRIGLGSRDTSLYRHFAESGKRIAEAAVLVEEMIATTSERSAVAAKIKEVEHAGDEGVHDVLQQVNSTFVTPFDREDIHHLVSRLDDVLDHLDSVASLLVVYGLGELPEEMAQSARIAREAAEVTAEAMGRLKGLGDLEGYRIEVNRLENEADEVYRATLARVLSGEYDPLTAVKLKDVAEELEDAVDALEDVADVVGTLVAKEA